MLKKINFLLVAFTFLVSAIFAFPSYASDPRFIDLNNGSVYDTVGRLIWLKNANCFDAVYWNAANNNANSLHNGQCGLTDGSVAGAWHLATLNEFRTLTGSGYTYSSLVAAGFVNVQNDTYWTSTRYDPDYYYYVNMGGGGEGLYNVNITYIRMWPVRSGPSEVNGACGAANGVTVTSTPSNNLCAYGTASTVSGYGPWIWTCSSQYGGSNANCSADILDTTPPTITFGSAPMNFSNLASGSIEFSANEPSTFECKEDTGSYTTCTSPFNFSSLANGKHTFTVKATDSAANFSEKSFLWTVNTALTASSAILLPRTGQTKCYDSAGVELPSCYNTGQDGDIQAGAPWPNARFTDIGNGTLKDNLSGLIWTKDANLMMTRDPSFDIDGTVGDGKVIWLRALSYITKLNNENYLGHNDWRLPNVNELQSLANFDQIAWLSSQGFSNVDLVGVYWSANSMNHINGTLPWFVYVPSSGRDPVQSTDQNSVWPVRGEPLNNLALPKTGQTSCNSGGVTVGCAGTGQDGERQTGVPWPSPRFTDNGNQTITDNLTGLLWTKNGNPASTQKNLQQALDYIKSLNISNHLGFNDWRLPNALELESLTNKGQPSMSTWLNGQGFNNVQGLPYATSSSTESPVSSYVILMGFGNVNGNNKSFINTNVWPVRGGYIQQKLDVIKSGNGAISLSTGTLTWNGNSGTTRIPPGDTITLTATPDSD